MPAPTIDKFICLRAEKWNGGFCREDYKNCPRCGGRRGGHADRIVCCCRRRSARGHWHRRADRSDLSPVLRLSVSVLLSISVLCGAGSGRSRARVRATARVRSAAAGRIHAAGPRGAIQLLQSSADISSCAAIIGTATELFAAQLVQRAASAGARGRFVRLGGSDF